MTLFGDKLFKDLVEPSAGKQKVFSDSADELFGFDMLPDDLGIFGRRFMSTASPYLPTNAPFITQNDAMKFDTMVSLMLASLGRM